MGLESFPAAVSNHDISPSTGFGLLSGQRCVKGKEGNQLRNSECILSSEESALEIINFKGELELNQEKCSQDLPLPLRSQMKWVWLGYYI